MFQKPLAAPAAQAPTLCEADSVRADGIRCVALHSTPVAVVLSERAPPVAEPSHEYVARECRLVFNFRVLTAGHGKTKMGFSSPF